MLNLNDREWKEFHFIDIFDINCGFYNKKPPKEENGTIPFLGATENNNGITEFYSMENIAGNSKTGSAVNEPLSKKIFQGNCICVTNNGSVGYAYYQVSKFTCSHDVNPLYLKHHLLNRHIALFLINAIEQQRVCFRYSRKWRPSRMVKSNIMLPITGDGQPDYAFMEQYIREREDKLKQKYIDFINAELYTAPPLPLSEKKWKAFKVKHLFLIEKCKCSNVSSLKKGDFPYVGATNRNNGIMAFVEKKDKWITKGNCIAFICDGQGSVGYSIYKKEDFIGSTTLKVGRNEHLNIYTAQFLVSALDKNRQMYSYGYKRNENRLYNESIMLPTTDEGSPDYEYMEQYIKAVMFGKYKKYLEYQQGTAL